MKDKYSKNITVIYEAGIYLLFILSECGTVLSEHLTLEQCSTCMYCMYCLYQYFTEQNPTTVACTVLYSKGAMPAKQEQ
jgi:hypothetical protein